MKHLTLALLMLVFVFDVHASEEGILAFSNFHIESDGIGSSGRIIIEGKQDENAKILSLAIKAFGKDHMVSKEKLATLGELRSNGIRISYEAGYAKLGGRTIYINLQMGFTSGTKKQALITVWESGKIEVGEIKKKDS